jgi:hypothetical protein
MDRPGESKIFRRLIVSSVAVKFLMAVIVYLLFPQIAGKTSDAGLYYLPEAKHVLEGQLPYRDFVSSYSVLFPVVLAPAVAVWRSIGAVVLVMLIFESLLLVLYLKCSPHAGTAVAYRVAFIYSFSPISAYWCGVTGYNGSIIALFALASLILVERQKATLASACAVCGLLCSKLLMLLSYPAILFFEWRGWRTRMASLALFMAASIGLPYFAGFDSLMPIKREIGNISSGNLWFLCSPFVSAEVRAGRFWNVGPLVAFAVTFAPLFVVYLVSLRCDSGRRDGRFDVAVAFLATTNLAFMILSKKSNSFYLLMAFLFILHTLVVDSRNCRMLCARLVPVTFLGAITTTEDGLWMLVRDFPLSEPSRALAALWVIDLVTVTCYAYLMVCCFRASIRTRTSSPS